MVLLFRSLAMLVPFLSLFCFSQVFIVTGQSFNANASLTSNARALDALLQDYAFRAFSALRNPKTGISYNGAVPANLTGIQIAVMRLRSGSLRTHGVKNYSEFEIPTGVIVQPYVERLVLVYQNLGSWSEFYYSLPNYSFLAPVLGLLAYSASNLSAKNLPELDFRAYGDPIKINFSDVIKTSSDNGSVPMCVTFDLRGLVNFSNLTSSNECSTFHQGHFSIVTTKSALPPPPPSTPPSPSTPSTVGKGNETNRNVWIIVGSVVGGLALLALLAFLVLWARKCKKRKKMQEMEKAAEVGEALHMTSVGDTKAPSATVTRTQPILESEYVP